MHPHGIIPRTRGRSPGGNGMAISHSMPELHPIDPLFSLDALAARIVKSSNFRFAWQFYSYKTIDPLSPDGVRDATDYIADTPVCHKFLRDSFDSMYDDTFSIEPIHEHCAFIRAEDRLANVLAAAANDTLGAYSRHIRDASPRQRSKITRIFSSAGDFLAFELRPGNLRGCRDCEEHNSHAFSTWFYRVAWDWCFVVTWPQSEYLWLGCLTDSD
jgi:hypothetical protein